MAQSGCWPGWGARAEVRQCLSPGQVLPPQSPPAQCWVSFVSHKARTYKYPNSKFSRSIRNSPGLFLRAVMKGL